ncbi:ATP-binding cassette domain-containing protein [Lysinibacillus sp. MHQ-1]|nr:ATP-binding cassette domain-containing protein [Lysinibacillus sp. MHQ-1]
MSTIGQNLLKIYTKAYFPLQMAPILKLRTERGDQFVRTEKISQKAIKNKQVLVDINVTIESGEIISLLGPSGCGKTTLLNIILGLTEQTGGQLLYNGQDISKKSMQERGFNIVFQDFALFPHLNAYDNIVYGLKNKNKQMSKEDVQEYIDFFRTDSAFAKKRFMNYQVVKSNVYLLLERLLCNPTYFC